VRKTQVIMKRSAIAVAVSTVFLLSACGGGGGGGGYLQPNSSNSGSQVQFVRTEVPYSTPVLQTIIDPLVNLSSANNGDKWAVADTFASDVTGDGNQDLLVAGRMTQSTAPAEWGNFRLSLLGWHNGQLVDKTAQWFPNDTNIILGTEPSVKFDDFFKTGRNDLFMSTGTDMRHYGPTYFYRNTGTSFERQTLTTANIWSHDSAVGDLNGDGYKDIVIADYGTNTTVAFNNRVSGFNVYTQSQANPVLRGASGVAIGDFLQNGQGQIIATDQWTSGSAATKLYSWNLDSSNALTFTEIRTLPTPRFELPKWASYNFGGSHNVRAVTYDFNKDGVPDALIFSRPTFRQDKYSEIQFLKNNGSGMFTDVTDDTLVGYNTSTYSTYNPKFVDLNGDGREDILVSGSDFSGNNNSHQFLLKSAEGKYVAAHQNILTDFVTQAAAIQGGDNMGNTINVIKGPGGKLYLVTTVSYMNGSDRQMAVYMSDLGGQSVTSAQTAINLILQKWPYMTAAQANTALAQTVATYFNGAGIINDEDIFKPVGSLSLPTITGYKAINGFIAGVNLGDAPVVAMDQVGRGYNMNLAPMNINRINAFGYNTEHNDQYELTSHAEYLVNGGLTTVNGMRLGGDYAKQDPTQYTIGVPNYLSYGKWSLGAQYTTLNSNPWIAFGGAWGSVTSSGIMDNVVSYRNKGFSAQASLMHASTNITPGLITKVSNMWGAWAEVGYRFGDVKSEGDIGLFAGVKPVVLSGSVEASLPSSIDNAGNIQYTSKKLAVQNQAIGYVRALYTNQLSKKSQLRMSAMATANGQYRAMTEFRFFLD
jgi:hypothetical protein